MNSDHLQVKAIPWYEAAVIRRVALAIVMHILGYLGVAKYFSTSDLVPIINDVLEALGDSTLVAVLHARFTKPTPPLAWSKKHADLINDLAQAASPASPDTNETLDQYKEI